MRQESLGVNLEWLHSFKSKREDDELSKLTEHEVPLREEDGDSLLLLRSQERRRFGFEGKVRSNTWKKWDEGYLRT